MTKRLGILGGGQLAMFMCQEATRLGIETAVLSPDRDGCAKKSCTHFIHGAYTDVAAKQDLLRLCDIITLDNEHIPASALEDLVAVVPVFPQPAVMAKLQDRLLQRAFLSDIDAPQVEYWSVDTAETLHEAATSAAFPAVLKSRRGGYDGYGQARVATAVDLPAAWDKLKRSPCVLEAWLSPVFEFSIVGVRNADGESRRYPPIANLHSGGQLMRSDMPAGVSDEIGHQAAGIWRQIGESLETRGVLTVEFFIHNDKHLLVNEIAPRVHNSGHITQLTSPSSQFKAHVCGVMGLPTPDLEPTASGSMWNLYPQHHLNDPIEAAELEQRIGGRILLYGKEPRPRRKLGHWLTTADTEPAVTRELERRLRDS